MQGITRKLLPTIGLVFLLMYVGLVIFRIGYPYQLEWIEGGAIEQTDRILKGQKLYTVPSIDFVPFIYTPLYFYVGALLTGIFGLGFLPLRLISVVATFGILFLIYRIVKKETNDSYSGIVAAMVFIATFFVGGAWLDLARTDPLFLLFLLTAFYLLRFGQSNLSYGLAGVVIMLAFMTKQTALIMAVPLVIGAFFLNWRRAIWLALSTLISVGGSILLMNWLHDGWFNYYVFDLPRNHAIATNFIWEYWLRDILASMLVAVLLAGFYLLRRFRERDKAYFWFYFFAAGGLIGGAWAGRLNFGGFNNVLLPAYAMLAIFFGLAIPQVLNSVKKLPERQGARLEGIFYLFCVLQFLLLLYNPIPQIPTAQDRQAGDELVALLKSTQGDILIPSQCYLLILNKLTGECAHTSAVAELIGDFGGEVTPQGEKLRQAYAKAFQERKYLMVVTDARFWLQKELDQFYSRTRPVFNDDKVFFPVVGFDTRPEYLYQPYR